MKNENKKDEKEVKEIEMKKETKRKNWTNEEKAMMIVAIILVIGLFVLIYPSLKSKINAEKTYSVEITEITGECEKCFDLASLTDSLVNNNVAIKSSKTLNYEDNEAKKLIEKYGIKRVPAMIINSKNIDKINLGEEIFFIGKNYAIFDKPVPYIDLSSGEINGIVNLKEIQDSNCIDCKSLSNLKESLDGLGVKIGNYEIINADSDEGKMLIEENNLTFLSSLLISKNIEEYWWFFEQIKKTLVENENYYAFKESLAPYKEISTGKIKGKVKITYITNKSCEDCFNVSQLKGVFQGVGVYIDSEKYVDVSSSEGKSLLNAYNIKAIPTAILSEEISDYGSVKDILEQVGSFENKKFILRKLDALRVKYQKTGV